MAEKKTKAKADAKPKKAASSKQKAQKMTAAKHSTPADDFRLKTPDQLGDELVKLKKESFNLRFQRANGQLEKTNRVRQVRRTIARIETILTEQRRKAAAAA